MKKLCGLLLFTILLFSIKSFGGNPLILSTGKKPLNTPPTFAGDTAKKIPTADTTKKTTDDDSSDDDDNPRSYAIGIMYGSDQSYHGIHANTKLPYIEPNFTYTAPKGFYALASVQDILIKKGGGFDAVDINPGWDISLADNTTLNVNYSKYFFRAGTPATIQSDLSNALATYIDQWIGQTEGKFTVAYDYYKSTDSVKTPGDIVLSPDIAHTFTIKLGKKSSLDIVPEGNVDFGTRNAYTHYEINAEDTLATSGVGKKRKQPTNSSFGGLDYTLLLTIDYKLGNFEFSPAFNYNKTLYKTPGVSSAPLKFMTISLLYTIE
jgi:hypothetical protein